MSAQKLEVSLIGVGTVLRLERDSWSMVKRPRQPTNEYAPPTPPSGTCFFEQHRSAVPILTNQNEHQRARGWRCADTNVAYSLQLTSKERPRKAPSLFFFSLSKKIGLRNDEQSGVQHYITAYTKPIWYITAYMLTVGALRTFRTCSE